MDPDSADRSLNILLVEDVEHDGRLVEAMLNRIAGGRRNRVTRVADSAHARRELEAGGYDVVLLDLTLPDSEGIETVRRVKRGVSDVPIVVLTGSDDEELGLACIRAGAQDYLPKSELRVPLLSRVVGYALARAREAGARQRLEQEVLESSERERQRIAHDLHDDLGQQLTGIALLARSLVRKLAERGAPEAVAAEELTGLIQAAIGNSMALARGLDPLTEHGSQLPTALEALAQRGETMFDVRCRLQIAGSIPEVARSVGTHLYRIAQEGLTNAVKHGGARNIDISLAERDGDLELVVRDDGKGVPPTADLERALGQGLRIMEYRARMIGATCVLEADPEGRGARVRCTLPVAG